MGSGDLQSTGAIHSEFKVIILTRTHSYAAYNYSAPRLPPGLKFSSTLRAVTNQAFDADGIFTSVIDGVSIASYWQVERELEVESFPSLRSCYCHIQSMLDWTEMWTRSVSFIPIPHPPQEPRGC